MCNVDSLLQTVIAQAIALDIPVSKKISPRVLINTRAKTRFGRCIISSFGGCTIEIAERVINGSEESCKAILAHEILHSCKGCRNHQALWKSYAHKMKAAYGYDIQRAHHNEALGLPDERPVRYRLQCQSCGTIITRMKKSPLIAHPEHYRCRCSGKLRLI